jgi:hypothetical protein
VCFEARSSWPPREWRWCQKMAPLLLGVEEEEEEEEVVDEEAMEED